MNDSSAVHFVGITGHQALTAQTSELVTRSMVDRIKGRANLVGVTSLAAGADQIFAQLVLDLGGSILAIMPARKYEKSFSVPEQLENCRRLLEQAEQVVYMPFNEPSEEAYWAAGQEVVRRADRILAVWDGKPAGGLGGTADVVQYARSQGKPVEIIWPDGARRS